MESGTSRNGGWCITVVSSWWSMYISKSMNICAVAIVGVDICVKEWVYALLHVTANRDTRIIEHAQLPGSCVNGSSVIKVTRLNGQGQSSMDCQCKFAAQLRGCRKHNYLVNASRGFVFSKIRNTRVITRSVRGYADGWGDGAKNLNVVRCSHTHR